MVASDHLEITPGQHFESHLCPLFYYCSDVPGASILAFLVLLRFRISFPASVPKKTREQAAVSMWEMPSFPPRVIWVCAVSGFPGQFLVGGTAVPSGLSYWGGM